MNLETQKTCGVGVGVQVGWWEQQRAVGGWQGAGIAKNNHFIWGHSDTCGDYNNNFKITIHFAAFRGNVYLSISASGKKTSQLNAAQWPLNAECLSCLKSHVAKHHCSMTVQ